MSGMRTLARTMSSSSRLGSPPRNSFSSGTASPSSNTSVASAPMLRPPMSVAWQVLANQPTPRPRWNTGVTTVKSNR